MHRYIPEFAGRPVPRYTSYPTAAEFGDGIGSAEQARALDGVAPGTPVSLYLHIPYCRAICWYCGCNTGALGKSGRLDAYRAALEAEIALVAGRMRGRVVSIHFGGGSPNALAPDDFVALVGTLRRSFHCVTTPEIAVELDPRAFDGGYADALASAGVTRASLGVQTFAAGVQARINRVQPFEQVAAVVADLRAAGIDQLNFDLLYGLPHQAAQDIADTVAATLTLAPDRIAMFGYAHLPRLLPRQRMIDATALPDAAARFEQSALAHDLLVEAGYRAIGFDHFARPEDSLAVAADKGRLRRNFQGFTDEAADIVVGLGASAISQFPRLIVQNDKHVGSYRLRVGNGALAGVRGVRRSDEDRLRGTVIERLLCDGAVDLDAVAHAHGHPVPSFAPALASLAALEAARLVAVEGRRVTILPAGRPYARLAAAAFDGYRGAPAQRFSRAV